MRKLSNPDPLLTGRVICPLCNGPAGGWRAGYRSRERAGHSEGIFLTKPEIRLQGDRTRDLKVLLGSLNHYARGPFATCQSINLIRRDTLLSLSLSLYIYIYKLELLPVRNIPSVHRIV
jgi:hypothetical protein